MNRLYLELSNYKNHLSPQSKIYFAAGNQLNSGEYKTISSLLNFNWITKETKVTEIIKYLNDLYKTEIDESILPKFKKWLTIQHVKIIFIIAIGKMLFKDRNFEMENLTPDKAATSFYLGAIYSQQHK